MTKEQFKLRNKDIMQENGIYWNKMNQEQNKNLSCLDQANSEIQEWMEVQQW